MKNLLTILLLLILAGQTSRYFHAITHEISYIQEADEKGEQSGEDKNEKEYLFGIYLTKVELPINKSFSIHSCKPRLSPVLDHLTPPPDVTV